MWLEDDPLDGLDRGAVARLADAVMAGKSMGVPSDLPKMPKLSMVKRKRLSVLPGEPVSDNLNETVAVSISLPAYLVVGAKDFGGIEYVTRMAVRDYLKARGVKWWYPRFLIRVDLPDEN